MKLKYQSETIGIIVCLSLGILSGYLSNSGDTAWYLEIIKPSFNPPSWIFGPVWSLLYVMMGIVFGKLYHQRGNAPMLLALFSAQFIFNLFWSPLFFLMHRIDFALIDLSLIWLTLSFFMLLVWKKRIMLCFWLSLPYFLWTTFAWFLNFNIFKLN